VADLPSFPDIADMRYRHTETGGTRRRHPDGFTTDYECDACHAAWPCETSVLLDYIGTLDTAVAAAAALEADQRAGGCAVCGGTGVAWDWPAHKHLIAALKAAGRYTRPGRR
jgi:hypothetical protein